jgi:hypothetical protein
MEQHGAMLFLNCLKEDGGNLFRQYTIIMSLFMAFEVS